MCVGSGVGYGVSKRMYTVYPLYEVDSLFCGCELTDFIPEPFGCETVESEVNN